ncbi:MAG: ABC transporter ATP-binding protein [Verrucomicrobia bacterium]|jgi:ABC-2 type transport system ATP-binding protein|nr:ABC transporter ATP-binding protein [Verrucomicrobiota bacterium]
MNNDLPVIAIQNLHRQFGKTDAVNGLNLEVKRGRCYGFFGRNGAGKTTTIKCLLNLLQPTKGKVRLFGLDPSKEEVKTKSRLAYVPDQVAVYPWMSVAQYFQYLASFRQKWNADLQDNLLTRFELDAGKKAESLSKGQKMQMALIAALCPEPELLILDEPTSGLDPLIRKEFIEVVIGAYQESDPENRTVLVSTHLITEFEGLIDEFMILDQGRKIFSDLTENARNQFRRIRVRFPDEPPTIQSSEIVTQSRDGRTLELMVHGNVDSVINQLASHSKEDQQVEALTLEEIFLLTAKNHTSHDFTRK